MSRSLTRLFLCIAIVLAAAPTLADTQTYAVRPGDTLSSIADVHHVSLSAIERRNGLTDHSLLQIGQTIVLRERAVVGPTKLARQPVVRPARLVPQAKHVQRLAASLSTAAARALFQATNSGTMLPGFQPETDTQSFAALSRGMRIAQMALHYVGVPYWWGGTGGGGFDCSGLVFHVFAKNGIALPRMADEQYAVGRRVASSQLRPGDLVFFQTYAPGASHVGIYVGNGNFIHASSRGVRVDPLSMSYYASRYIGARRSL